MNQASPGTTTAMSHPPLILTPARCRPTRAGAGKRPTRRRGDQRAAAPRPSLESLESRTTVSDALFSAAWLGLLANAEPPLPASEFVGAEGPVTPIFQNSDRSTSVRATPGRASEPDESATVTVLRGLPVSVGPVTVSAGPFELNGARPAGNAVVPPRDAGYATVVGSLPAVRGEVGPLPQRGELALPPAAAEVRPGAAALVTEVSQAAGSVALTQPGMGLAGGAPRFEASWQAGGRDSAALYMGATELMNLEGHQGRLFAGTSVLSDVPGDDPRVGAQILRLDAPDAPWRVDHSFGDEYLPFWGQMRFVRVEDLESVTFTTDGHGTRLPEPVHMLLAAPSDLSGQTAVYSRDDATGAWTPMVLFRGFLPRVIRSLGFHHDAVTGVDRVFAGVSAMGTYSGVYDPTAPGRIRWEEYPEFFHERRVTGFAEANGTLFMTPSHDLYRRVDGPEPGWALVYEGPLLRGLSAVPNPEGPGQVLLASTEEFGDDSLILRIHPTEYTVTEELNVSQFLRERWGYMGWDFALAGYNEATPVVIPGTGETVHLIGLVAYPPPGVSQTSAWCLTRDALAQYQLHEIPALPNALEGDPDLQAVRTIVVSPFAQDAGRVVYLGGYDVGFSTAHNSAWIYRVSLTG